MENSGKRSALILFLTVALIAAGAVVFLVSRAPAPVPSPAPAAPPPAATTETPTPQPAAATEAQLPPTTEPATEPTDEQIRASAAQCLGSPLLARLLESQALAGKAVAVVDLIARGESPRKFLSALQPEGKFRTVQRDEREYLDPASYERYTPLADAVEAMDQQACARLYQRLGPWLEKKYREIGEPGRTFRQALTDAIGELLKVPAFDGDIPLSTTAVNMKMDIPELEALSDAQKHLLRMGPKNIRRIQEALRKLSAALGLVLQ